MSFPNTIGEEIPYLSSAEAERLAILLEELGEAQQAIGKILRHGYYSFNPDTLGPNNPTNREHLERELGDVLGAIVILDRAKDVRTTAINAAMHNKLERVGKYTHHQPKELLGAR